MYRLLVLAIVLFQCINISAQTTQVRYYNNRGKEVPEKKAKYKEETIRDPEGTVTTQKTNLIYDYVVYSETYKKEEPYGIWILPHGSILGKEQAAIKLNYNFSLAYTDKECINDALLPKPKETLEDDANLNYLAPKLANNENINRFISKNLFYPSYAKENNIQGRILFQYTVNKDGTVKDVFVLKGVHISLDKEAARVIKKMKFETPPKVNGEPINICVKTPVSFWLE